MCCVAVAGGPCLAASRPELKAMLANTRLQDVLTRIDGAPDREQVTEQLAGAETLQRVC